MYVKSDIPAYLLKQGYISYTHVHEHRGRQPVVHYCPTEGAMNSGHFQPTAFCTTWQTIHVSEFHFTTKTHTYRERRIPFTLAKNNTVMLWSAHNWWLKTVKYFEWENHRGNKEEARSIIMSSMVNIKVCTNLNFSWLEKWTDFIVISKIINTHLVAG